MIKELWPGVTLEEYNKWYPLTGPISVTPEKYIEIWPDEKNWFKTFALRAQNDINAYLNFILDRFPFETYIDKRIQETLVDMVFVSVEHWVYNRTPIEFNSDAGLTFNNGQTQINSFALPTINIWDLHPSRMKIWANLTGLKKIFDTSQEEGLVDANLIDLDQFYSKTQTDQLLDLKQNITDNNLQTTAKEIVPAINEVNEKIPDVAKFETKEDHEKDFTYLKESKSDSVWVSDNFELKQNHKTDIDNLQGQVDNKANHDDLVWIYSDEGKINPKLAKPNLIPNLNGGQFQGLAEPTYDWNVTTKNYVDEQDKQLQNDIDTKQIKLKPGGYINVDDFNNNNTISVDTTQQSGLQPRLTAGLNIKIDANHVISAELSGNDEVITSDFIEIRNNSKWKRISESDAALKAATYYAFSWQINNNKDDNNNEQPEHYVTKITFGMNITTQIINTYNWRLFIDSFTFANNKINRIYTLFWKNISGAAGNKFYDNLIVGIRNLNNNSYAEYVYGDEETSGNKNFSCLIYEYIGKLRLDQ